MQRGRKPNAVVLADKPAIDGELIAADLQTIDTHAAEQRAASEAARTLAKTLGYEGSLDPDVLEDGAGENKRRVESELMELGARWLLIREQCPHGEFLARLERQNLAPRAAQKFMQLALKFSNAPTLAHLGKSKLLELAVLDDSEITELAEGGSARGIQIGDADRMSVRELKAALAEAKATISAKDTVAKQLTESNQKLREQIARAPAPTPEMRHAALLKDLSDAAMTAAAHVTAGIRSAAIQLLKESGEHDPVARQAVAAALGQVAAATRGLSQDLAILPQADGAIDAEGAEDAAIWEATMRDFNAQKAAEASEQAPAPTPGKPLRAVRRSDDHGQPSA